MAGLPTVPGTQSVPFGGLVPTHHGVLREARRLSAAATATSPRKSGSPEPPEFRRQVSQSVRPGLEGARGRARRNPSSLPSASSTAAIISPDVRGSPRRSQLMVAKARGQWQNLVETADDEVMRIMSPGPHQQHQRSGRPASGGSEEESEPEDLLQEALLLSKTMARAEELGAELDVGAMGLDGQQRRLLEQSRKRQVSTDTPASVDLCTTVNIHINRYKTSCEHVWLFPQMPVYRAAALDIRRRKVCC